MTSLESSGLNAGYVEQLLEQYLDNPEAVDPAWREVFERDGDSSFEPSPLELEGQPPSSGNGGTVADQGVAEAGGPAPPVTTVAEQPKPETAAPRQAPDNDLMGAVAAAMSLVKAYRMHGHLNARLDPLGSEPMETRRSTRRVWSPADAGAAEPHSRSTARLYVPGSTLLSAPHLKEVYAGTIAYEIEHLITPSASGFGRGDRVGSLRRLSPTTTAGASSSAWRGSRRSRRTFAARSSARSSFRSRGSTSSCRCSTKRLSSRREAARTRS
jgi:2-oxoglutarate dehydrogenase complex dehydrogenase (E1) component-like enzyme